MRKVNPMPHGTVRWHGTLTGIQPRIRLTRSFDERWETYLGYVLRVEGYIQGQVQEFSVGITEALHAQYQFRVGDTLSGVSLSVANPDLDPVDYDQTTEIKVIGRDSTPETTPPPWTGVAPDSAVYQARGFRRLRPQTYTAKCGGCIWGCRMAVEMIVNQWNPRQKQYRTETFCFGPKSCAWYVAGPVRIVPGRRGMVWEEADWIDAQETAHRGMHE